MQPEVFVLASCPGIEISDCRYRRLLRTRREGPSDDRAAEKCDELAPTHLPSPAKDHAKIDLRVARSVYY